MVILIDTLRADHLGIGGYVRATSPNLDAFASSSSLFSNAHSQASCTFPSVNSLLTSRYPSEFYGQENQAVGIPESHSTLASLFRSEGYWTFAVSASPIVRANPSAANPGAGFDRGFDIFDDRCQWQAATCVLDRFYQGLAQRPDPKSPFLAYLHFIDPHGPYSPPEDHPRRFARPWSGAEFVAKGDPNPIARSLRGQGPPLSVNDEELKALIDRYDEEILYLDGVLGSLFRELEPGGNLEGALVAIVADHGESFLEHPDAIKHCFTLWKSELHTPFVLHRPGQTEGQRIDSPVRNLDLVPTLLDLSGLPFSPGHFVGRSLRPLLAGEVAESPWAPARSGSLRSVTDGRHKLILRSRSRDTLRFFEVEGIEREIAPEDSPREFRRARQELSRFLDETEAGVGSQEMLRRGEDAIEGLRAVGYLQ